MSISTLPNATRWRFDKGNCHEKIGFAIVLLIVFTLSLALSGCQKSEVKSTFVSESESEEDSQFISVEPGETVESETATLTLFEDDAVWAKTYMPTDNSIFVWEADEGEVYLVLNGSIENNSRSELLLESLDWSLVIDGEIEYDEAITSVLNSGELSIESEVPSKGEKSFVVGFEVVDGVKDSCAKLEIRFILDGVTYSISFENSSTNDSDEVTRFEKDTSVSGEDFSMTMSGLITMDEILPPDPMDGMAYFGYGENEEGMTWVVFEAILTNDANEPIYEDDLITSRIITIEGKEYEAEIRALENNEQFSHDALAPAETKTVYIYASIPDSLIQGGIEVALNFRSGGVLFETSATL